MRSILAAIALVFATPVLAGEPAPWRPVDAETGQIRDIEGLEQLARDFPDSGTVRLRLLQRYIEAGEVEKVMKLLEWLYDRGYVFSDVAQEQIPKLYEGVDPGRIAERLIAEAEVIAASDVAATVPAEYGLIEGVVAPADEDFFAVTSVTSNDLVLFTPELDWFPLGLKGANDLSGIVSAPNGRIAWVASSNLDGSSDDSQDAEPLFVGLIGLTQDIENTIRVAAPEGVSLADIHLGEDGIVYASDPMKGGVYQHSRGTDQLDEIVPPGTFRSPQGLATSADNTKLYVSDYRYGIAIIDLKTREVSRLASDISIILDGVDGLWRYGSELIAVQNGTSPMRISAFRLSDDGLRVVSHRILEQANPEWTEPLGGSLDGDDLIYVGNGQWDRYVQGELARGKEALATQIRRLPLARK